VPPRESSYRIADILREARKVVRYTEGMDRAGFEADERTVDAVLRCIGVIGEAASRLPDGALDEYPTVPWKNIKAMRNVVIHAYFGVSIDVVWQTVTVAIPDLITALSARD